MSESQSCCTHIVGSGTFEPPCTADRFIETIRLLIHDIKHLKYNILRSCHITRNIVSTEYLNARSKYKYLILPALMI